MTNEFAKKTRIAEGWGWPGNSRKAHYFVDGQSLCGKWLYFGDIADGNWIGPDDCKRCVRLFAKRKSIT